MLTSQADNWAITGVATCFTLLRARIRKPSQNSHDFYVM